MKKIITMIALSTFVSAAAMAGECVISIDRKACPGKETEAMKPYNGKNPTEEKKTFSDLAGCQAWAEKSAKIVRKGTLASKTVTGKFDGQDLKSTTEKSECK